MKMRFTRIRFTVVSALCLAVVLCGVGLWVVESRLVSKDSDCGGAGSPRAVPGVLVTVDDRATLGVLDTMLSRLGCGAPAPARVSVK
ncbi:hypothetical protein AXK60_19915 [Tsukamurella pseudospumae]|uniref:Uncharacterized protein n=2 Tax=Tsukamurella pseudospumae TaxID=239498 RepID=A0A138A0Q2_9ACTN|nr:hypothetical protein AXK60_19915 [Tsukamurella pseudospumae]